MSRRFFSLTLMPGLAAAVLIGLTLLFSLPVAAQPNGDDPQKVIDDFAIEFEAIEARLEQGNIGTQSSDEIRLGLERSRANLLQIVADAEDRLAPLREQLSALGAAPSEGETETPEIAGRRAELNAAVAKLEGLVKGAQQSATQARNLFDQITAIERAEFRRNLIERSPSPLSPDRLAVAGDDAASYIGAIASEIRVRLLTQGAMGSVAENLALPGLLAIAALVLGVFVRRWLVARLERAAADAPGIGRRVVIGLGLTVARLIVTMLALTILLICAHESGLFGPVGQSLIKGLAICAAMVIGAYALGNAYFAPHSVNLRISSLDGAKAASANAWLLCLSVIVGLDAVLRAAYKTPPFGTEALSVGNLVLLLLGGFVVWRFVRIAGIGVDEPAAEAASDDEDDEENEPDTHQTRRLLSHGVRLVTSVAAVLAPLLAVFGFFAASRFTFYPVIFSCAAIGVCYLLFAAVRAAVNGSTENESTDVPGEAARKSAPAPLQLIPVMFGFLLAIGVAPVLALIWGADFADLQTLISYTVEGFSIGDVTIAPFDFVLFVVVFIAGYMITRILQGLIRRSVLPYTRMDSGARSAILAGIGYIGVFLSALIAISATGLDLSNLAIVAGALSVGIGFGLQNIVNNFVSGIILLIERPIKTGDWVEIGGVHGTVQRVNVRSTEIQTFDRSTMFVPNADLISGTVTNWTHGNAHGRLIVPVGVAYGSDARKVEAVLLEVARAHPMLLRRPAPYIVFAGFGADSLDFEIRGVLRDVNWILTVASDMRYEIYEKLAEAGIEIPFAQRDVTIKNITELKGGQPGTSG